MEVRFKEEGQALKIYISGRLDSNTAPKAEKAVAQKVTDEIKNIEFDLEKLEYISSAGLRLLLTYQKKMTKGKSMKVTNVSREVMDIFEATGFDDVLTIY